MHRIWVHAGLPGSPGELLIEGEEATHALRVKRLREGERVELLDGRGVIGAASVIGPVHDPHHSGKRRAEPGLRVRVDSLRSVEAAQPEVHLYTATPKGGRVDDMIEQLAQIGAASWSPLVTALGVVEPGRHKLDRLERIALESCKQCGRAHLMTIGPEVTLEHALGPSGGARVLMAHASGTCGALGASAGHTAEQIRVLIGPEGDWTPDELAQGDRAGAIRVTLGPHIMRIATAACAAAAQVLGESRS